MAWETEFDAARTLALARGGAVDAFTGDGPLDGRVTETGQTWWDANEFLVTLDGRMQRDPLQAGTSWNYPQLDLTEDVYAMWAQVSWDGEESSSDIISENGGFVFINTNDDTRAGTPPNLAAPSRMNHPVYGPWAMQTTLYEATQVLDAPQSFLAYPGGRLPIDGTVTCCGWELRGLILSIYCPDGSLVKMASPEIEARRGPHMVWQIFNSNAPNLTPRYEQIVAVPGELPNTPRSVPLPNVYGQALEPKGSR